MEFPSDNFDPFDTDCHPEAIELGAELACEDSAAETLLDPVDHSLDPKVNVLVLEDDPLQLRILTQHIGSLGLHVLAAHRLDEARRLLQSEPIQVAIFDLHLPDGSGFDLCEEIDNDPHLVGLPIVVLSSLKQSDIVRQTRAVGGSFFISKPYDPNVLMTIIEQLIDHSL